MSLLVVAQLILGPAIVAALVSGVISYLQKRAEDTRSRRVSALQAALHLEQYAFYCAQLAYTVYAARQGGKVPTAKVAAFRPYPEEIAWNLITPNIASDAVTLAINSKIARGIVAATEAVDLAVSQSQYRNAQLGLKAWRIANELRVTSKLPRLDHKTFDWDFISFLRGESEKEELALHHHRDDAVRSIARVQA
jgi:hypothetical protein